MTTKLYLDKKYNFQGGVFLIQKININSLDEVASTIEIMSSDALNPFTYSYSMELDYFLRYASVIDSEEEELKTKVTFINKERDLRITSYSILDKMDAMEYFKSRVQKGVGCTVLDEERQPVATLTADFLENSVILYEAI